MLDLRLREMYAIERAVRMNRDPQLIGSFLGTIDDSRRGAKVILTDPVGSVLRIPKAVGAGINDYVNVQNRRSGGEIRRRVAAELDCDPETTNTVLATLLDWHTKGWLAPHISHRLPLERAGEALDLLRSRKATGKVVVMMDG